ncbi:MAG TPA: nitrite/sulfite reductase [Nitrososphaeraceae archaeon]
MQIDIDPNFRTNQKDYSKVEIAKLNSNNLRGNLVNEFRDRSTENISWESEQIAKSHGIYLEYNRANTGREKDWMYMIRISIPGGGPITYRHWNILDNIAELYSKPSIDSKSKTRPSLRITTRQNIQLHWIRKNDVVNAINEIAKSGFFTINGCGDNTRNVIGCPLARYSDIFDSNEWAQKVGRYFALPSAAYIEIFEIDPYYLRQAGLYERQSGITGFDYGPNQLNRKFKIAFSAIHEIEDNKCVPDNCVELRTNDIGVAPVISESKNDSRKADRFQVFVGGGQGQQSGKPTIAALGESFGIFTEENLLKGLDAIVRVHKEWGDRQNRHWARLKYVIRVKGIEWFREQVKNLAGNIFESPILDHDYGKRNLHLGWTQHNRRSGDNTSIKWWYGAFIENGRLVDGGPNGDLKSMIKFLVNKYTAIQLFTTPNQHLLFSDIEDNEKDEFERDMKQFGYGLRKQIGNLGRVLNARPYSTLRMLSGACVGRDTCRLTYTDSEKFEPYLIDTLEERWGDFNESIGVTGCEKQCYRPATKTVGWVGTGFNLYQLILMGTEDGKHQGGPLVDPETNEQYLRFVPRNEIKVVTDALFEMYSENRSIEESKLGGMGYFFRRIKARGIISNLKSNPKTGRLMTRTFKM